MSLSMYEMSVLTDIRSAIYRTNELLDELLEPVRKQREGLQLLAEQVLAQMANPPMIVTNPETGPGGSFVGGRIIPFIKDPTDLERELNEAAANGEGYVPGKGWVTDYAAAAQSESTEKESNND